MFSCFVYAIISADAGVDAFVCFCLQHRWTFFHYNIIISFTEKAQEIFSQFSFSVTVSQNIRTVQDAVVVSEPWFSSFDCEVFKVNIKLRRGVNLENI